MIPVEELVRLMNGPSAKDKALVEKAYSFVAEAHKDHKRFSGEPYMVHLVETARALAKLGMSATVVVAGLLHDSIEDVGVLPETIEKEFGKEVRFLVEGVTKLGHFKYRGTERHVESLRKLLIATGKDARVLIIKLMDRLHNMRTLSHVPTEKRLRIAQETLEIYAAIAHRLGMGLLRRDLEDLAFEHAYPEQYATTKKLLAEHTSVVQEDLEKMSRSLKRAFAENGITDFTTETRVKGLYSLWKKLERKGGDISKVHDIAALRIIVPTVEDCYRALGVVHHLWQPLPNKIKDYIAFPKPNGYQSLHTTVFAGDGGIIEIQIRTPEMHRESQFGIASHVAYKEHPDGTVGTGRQSSLDWVRSLIPSFARRDSVKLSTSEKADSHRRNRYGAPSAPEWLAELGGEAEGSDFETSLKTDFFTHRVFVFTPKGDVVDLPVDATPIDFAYAIHSDIGDHMFSAKVNGKLVPLGTPLHNGDIVEVSTKKSAKPTTKWLDHARTTLARRHIRNALEQEKNNRPLNQF